MDFIQTLWLSVMGIFSVSTPVAGITGMDEEQFEIKLINDRAETPSEKLEIAEEGLQNLVNSLETIRQRKINKNKQNELVSATIKKIRKKENQLKIIRLNSLTAKVVEKAPKKTVISEELEIEFTYPVMDFTKIIEKPDKYQKEYLKESNIEFFSCSNNPSDTVFHRNGCIKGVEILCHMNNDTPPLRAGKNSEGVKIMITTEKSRKYFMSKIQPGIPMLDDDAPDYLKEFEIPNFRSISTFVVDNRMGVKVENMMFGIDRLFPGKNHNYIIETESGEQPCVQEIINSIKFLDK